MANNLTEWWTSVLLGQKQSAHPIFGDGIDVDVDKNIVTLRGEVESPDAAEELEREARSLPNVDGVVSHLRVVGTDVPRHRQTVVAVYANDQEAQLAAMAVNAAKIRNGLQPHILHDSERARAFLSGAAQRAQVPQSRVADLCNALAGGKVILTDRLAEADVVRVISALEGTPTESLQTLPPEPEGAVTA